MNKPLFDRKQMLVVSAVVAAMIIFSAGLLYVSYANVKGHLKPFLPILIWQTAWWAPWIPLFPFIVGLSSRFPIDRHSWLRGALVHLAGSIVFSMIHLILYILLARLAGGMVWEQLAEKPDAGLFEVMAHIVSSPFMVNFRMRLLIYTIIVMVSHAVDYYHRYQKQGLEASKLQIQLAQAQLQALRMQLHPHFLFNTLNSVSALLYKDVTAAEEMIRKLINFLNLTLEDSGPQEVTLEKELEFLKNYLQIEQIRFQDRLVVSFQIAPDALKAMVPNLIMQPIVENAIRHGVASRSTAGHIQVRATRSNGLLQIVVNDNGPGLPSGNGTLREGVGISNTRSRLQQIYGDAFRFELANANEGGVNVILEFPYHSEEAPART